MHAFIHQRACTFARARSLHPIPCGTRLSIQQRKTGMQNLEDTKLAIIGLGYVGLPLAAEFGKHYDTLGFDINQRRIEELSSGVDHTLEVTGDELAEAHRLRFSSQLADLADRNVFIVTVPTPID